MKRKLEPIEMFCETVLSEGKIKGMTCNHFYVRNTGTETHVSIKMATELAREAWLYQQFFIKQNRLARLVNDQTKGYKVAPVIMEQAKDEFVQARDRCIGLQMRMNYAEVEVEDGSDRNH